MSCSPAAMRATALRRISSLTGTERHPDARSSPRVAGRLASGMGAKLPAVPPGHAAGRYPPAMAAERGLSNTQVAERVQDGRANRAPRPASRPLGAIVRANVLTRFNAILGTLLVVILIVGPIQDALFGVVLVANTAIGIAQEWRGTRPRAPT